MNATLTLQDLTDLIESFPPIPWTAFTVSPRAWAIICSMSQPDSPQGMFGSFNGLEVIVLNNQRSGVLQWRNKEMMRDFIKRLEAGEDLLEANFLDAAERIEEAMWPQILD